MSERVSIGGVVYESVGSSNSNLLFKCNGTARILWGNKLIDLIKNGKISSAEDGLTVKIISSESDIINDGLYIIEADSEKLSPKVLIKKDGSIYNISTSDIFISASNKLDITVELQKQALENIGFYYLTLSDVQNSGIQNGLVYVINDKCLYTIKEGSIEELEAKIRTITVDKSEDAFGNIINDSVKISLLISDLDYIVLSEGIILIKYPVHISENVLIGSNNADKNQGYRFYMDRGISYLDIDEINVRNGLKISQHTETTVSDFILMMDLSRLIPHQWYLISDYQNPWRIPANSTNFNRPILIRAISNNSIYQEGYLYDNLNIRIKYNPRYVISVNVKNESSSETTIAEETPTTVNTRGCITWMRDEYGNEANFDFLDYSDYNNLALVTLHKYSLDDNENLSIFPTSSRNNKIIIQDILGTVFTNGELEKENVSSIDFLVNPINNAKLIASINNEGNILQLGLTNCPENWLTLLFKLSIPKTLKILESDNGLDITITEALADNYKLSYRDLSEGSEYVLEIKISRNNISDGSVTYEHLLDIKCDISNLSNESIYTSLSNALLVLSDFSSIALEVYYITLMISEGKLVIKEDTASEMAYAYDVDTTYKVMYDNNITCSGKVIIAPTCTNFYKNTIENLQSSTIKSNMFNTIFISINNCVFEIGTVCDVTCKLELSNINFSLETHLILYDTTQIKELYNRDGTIVEYIPKPQTFTRGMIVMHSGLESIPYGWAVCDGRTYNFDGVNTTTPNLIGRFIKAVATNEDVGETNNPDLIEGSNTFTIQEKHLPLETQEYDLSENSEGTTIYTSREGSATSFSIEPHYYSLIFIMKL